MTVISREFARSAQSQLLHILKNDHSMVAHSSLNNRGVNGNWQIKLSFPGNLDANQRAVVDKIISSIGINVEVEEDTGSMRLQHAAP